MISIKNEIPNSVLKEFLDSKHEQYNTISFIEEDPISIPHSFSKKEDIEISGFIAAILSWGNRKTIINKSKELISIMDNSPYDFVLNHKEYELKRFKNFKHRTFTSEDCIFFIQSLQNIYINHSGLENVFQSDSENSINSIKSGLINFRWIFFELEHLQRTQKHIANILKNASAKRLNMFLRWMVRNDGRGVDFGIWNSFSPSALYCPLDVHTGNVSRKLGLLTRKIDDWLAVEELTNNLRSFDVKDPVKYDFALFGLGRYEDF